jgi:hypothetical protein
MKTKTSGIALLLGAGIALASLSVQAATAWTWVLNSSPTGTGLPGSANVTGYVGDGNGASLTAVSKTSDYTDAANTMSWWGWGYGICNGSEFAKDGCQAPQHAIDNEGNQESILLSFGKKVTLTSLDIGWSQTDSDVSIIAYTGSGTPTPSSYSGMAATGSGWTIVGNYASDPGDNTTGTSKAINASSVSSSYWLIAAYNSVFNAAGAATGACTAYSSADSSCYQGNDHFKVYAVGGQTSGHDNKVPEPSALLLFGTALVGALGLRRRNKGMAG